MRTVADCDLCWLRSQLCVFDCVFVCNVVNVCFVCKLLL